MSNPQFEIRDSRSTSFLAFVGRRLLPHHPLTAASHRGRERRGALLLVCLSLLVLFAVISVTFVLVAGQYRRTLTSEAKVERYGDDYKKQLDSAFGQVVRGTKNANSSIRFHDLLGDMYGRDGWPGEFSKVDPVTLNPPLPPPVARASGQFIDLPAFDASGLPPNAQHSGFFNGVVLTMLDGPARGMSTRVLGYVYDGSTTPPTGTLRIMAYDELDTATFVSQFGAYANDATKAPIRFQLNGRPFTGTGFGFNSTNGKIDNKADGTHLDALLPHQRFSNVGDDGGADEDYDAHDFQNMALAFVTPGATASTQIMPSFHRPDLINYWEAHANISSNPDLLRKVMLRPNTNDHPDFTGSNPAVFNPITGPWDVDNDGDSIPDSVWLDLGYPVQTASDGRQFKPLFAILCIDLDGRLNVNSHGSLAQADTVTYSQPFGGYFAGGTSSANLSRGLGWGPAEINLKELFLSGDQATQYPRLLLGDAGLRLPGRYGELAGTPAPGVSNAEEPLSYAKQYQFSLPGRPNQKSSFAIPPDLFGRGAVALDLRGTPLFMNMGSPDETLDDPYEINLARKQVRATSAADEPFAAGELESMLRQFDVDATTLPSRLRTLLNPGVANQRQLVTTDAFDLPVPAMQPTRELRSAGLHFVESMIDLINAKAGTVLSSQAISQLLPPELIGGVKMDINRPLGNGRDDDVDGGDGADPDSFANEGNGIVDEPGETFGGAPERSLSDESSGDINLLKASFDNVNFDHNNDGVVDSADTRARQLMARHLYVLIKLLHLNEIDFDPSDTTTAPSVKTARGLAQWAINVVEFRDRDSICSPFEYDLNPFADDDGNAANGTWDVDGILGDGTGTVSPDDGAAYRGLVWGCERPELLISETLAFHDRRTEDLPVPRGKTDDPPPGETDAVNDFDQRLRPFGSFFVELYNPWRTAYSTAVDPADRPSTVEVTGEYYDSTENVNQATGVWLNRTSPGGAPVWRIIVVKGVSKPKDPDHPVAGDRVAAADIERKIYFTQPPGAANPADYYPSAAPAPLKPGRYAVLGGSGLRGDGVTPIGRLSTLVGTDPADYTTTRRIVLAPDSDPDVNQVSVANNTSNPPERTMPDIEPIVAVMVDRPRSLNISEPISGYNPIDAGGTPFDTAGANGDGIYTQPHDVPLDDDQANAEPVDYAAVKTTGTTAQFRTVHLQRLANPLADFNATTNPYLTIDSMSVDLTVFNGITNVPEPTAPTIAVNFTSLQRGEDPQDGSAGQNKLWSHEQDVANNLASPGTSDHFFDENLNHTLGCLNKDYGVPYTSSSGSNPAPIAAADQDRYKGEPSVAPFPWLAWHNRPFVSPLEIVLVPKSRSSRLLYDYTLGPSSGVYSAPVTGHGHLLSFFEKEGASPSHLYRVLDYLRVPSPYVGAETLLNPAVCASRTTGPSDPDSQFFHPPFNYVLTQREPGRINLNTISSGVVWEGILNGRTAPAWPAIVESRRGFNPVTTAPGVVFDATQLNPDWPSVFANPFRSAAGAELTASLDAALPPLVPTPRILREDIDVTLVRPSDADTSATTPLFDFVGSAQPYNDPDRNPYFRYEELRRISNLVTTRSNVYAIWITMGYFEVTAGAVDPVHPDGYRLTQEMGAETGEITRHRAFYIYDRSIPVGYQRGQDLNIEKGILLKRVIE